jgi:hypothetical protein
VAGGKTGATEEAAGGFIGATRGAEGKAGVVVATHGMRVEVRAIGCAVGPKERVVRLSAPATWAVRPPGGTVRLPEGVLEPRVVWAIGPPGGVVGAPVPSMIVVRLPEGTVRPSAMVAGVP